MTEEQNDETKRLEHADYESMFHELAAIRSGILAEAARSESLLDEVYPGYRESARNLLHYLTLRHRDLRALQQRLAAVGLSSLGRAESHVMATIDAVLCVLQQLIGSSVKFPTQDVDSIDYATGERLLVEHTEALLGPSTSGRWVRIMVTMPSEAADDYQLVYQLLQAGMECMRINCAHDDSASWSRMIEHLQRAERELGKSCRVVMDLAGPKLRTGPLKPGPQVIKIRPRRDQYGRVTEAACVWLSSVENPRISPKEVDASLPVAASWLKRLQQGDQIKLQDARDSRRSFTVTEVSEDGCRVEAVQTTYLIPGTRLRHERGMAPEEDCETLVGELPARENCLNLQRGDQLIVTRDLEPGGDALRNEAGQVTTPARIGCTIPEVFDDVHAGESIWFDDGKIGGIVEQVERMQAVVRITQTRLQGSKLRPDKGINLPESKLSLAALTEKDLEDLTFVAQHADVVELSFANRGADVEFLQAQLKQQAGRFPAIVLKIETRSGFENLPDMLLLAMRSSCCGVMIARGDLAVECGFERMAEVQEEILRICEAAHVPVIWATQVLETLAKEGIPSRAEITDAAMGHRAECVMLNKGPHVLQAVKTLDDILRRMQAHQTKKRAMLRELRLSTHAVDLHVSRDMDSKSS